MLLLGDTVRFDSAVESGLFVDPEPEVASPVAQCMSHNV